MSADLVARLRAAGCVYAEEEAALLRAADDDLVTRRIAGEPLEHVLGWAAFRGLRIAVEPGVFVPRRRTELLASLAVAAASPADVVLDLCCGSGAVGIAVAHEVPVVLHAVDVDPVAVRCATRNVAPYGGHVYLGDLYAPLPAGLRADVVAVNAPYVPTAALATLPVEARWYEPRHAHDGGADGLDVARRVLAGIGAWLAPGGTLLVETSAGQADTMAALFTAAGLAPRVVHDETYDATVVAGGQIGSQAQVPDIA